MTIKNIRLPLFCISMGWKQCVWEIRGKSKRFTLKIRLDWEYHNEDELKNYLGIHGGFIFAMQTYFAKKSNSYLEQLVLNKFAQIIINSKIKNY